MHNPSPYKLGFMLCFTVIASVIGIRSAFCIDASARMHYSMTLKKQGEAPCLSPQEVELIKLVNQYRESKGLPALANSRSLVKVARIHARDLQDNYPEQTKDSRGKDCNLHSWSDRGYWAPVCYTNDHKYADLMRSKPREITANAYDDAGYESVYWTSGEEVNPARALLSMSRSQLHNAMILESGKWSGINFKSIGVGVSDNYAVIWFGSLPDPLGSMKACTNSSK